MSYTPSSAIWPADVDVGDGSESQIKNDILDDVRSINPSTRHVLTPLQLLSDILLPPVYKSGGARLVVSVYGRRCGSCLDEAY